MNRPALAALALRLLAPALLASVAVSQHTFTFPIDGIQAGTGSPGTGTVTVTLDSTTGIVTADGTFQGMWGNALGVHIHGPAAPGLHAPVKIVLTYTGTTSGTIGGGGPQTDPMGVQDMLAGLYYVMVHTSVVGGGELRGQIVAVPEATPYGSGVNPANSLFSLSGGPAVGAPLRLAIDNPTGSQSGPGVGFLLVTAAPDPSFGATGVGTLLPGYGMAGPFGELLVGAPPPTPLLIFPTSVWTTRGVPAQVSIPVPDSSSFVGLTLYAQGALYANAKIGLTNGLELYIGM
ncbi:MAG TPA: CHRD domain-containing protein [Planctomycetota bacterium]|nr:CHRD domain-containing protein [Planctomycetota bacterium]